MTRPKPVAPGPLFEVPVRELSRTTDPGSSHQAASGITGRGKAKAQRQRCFDLCLEYPGLTSDAYDSLMGVREVARKRFPELRSRGLVTSSQIWSEKHGQRVQHWFPSGKRR